MARQTEAFIRRLTGEDGQRLVRTAHTGQDRVPQRRAMILLASAQGRSVEAIAGLLEVSVDYVREVIHAFNAHGFETLHWVCNGMGGPRTDAGTIAGALAASPWPGPLTWASRLPRRQPQGDRFEPSKPSSGAASKRDRLAGLHDAQIVLQPPAGWTASRAPDLPSSGPPAPTPLTGNAARSVDAEGNGHRHLHEPERPNPLRKERELLKAAAFLMAASQKI